MKRILFFQPGGLGDSIFSLPLLKSIRKQWPQAVIDALAREKIAIEFYREQFNFNRIFYVPNKIQLLLRIPLLISKHYSLLLVPTAVNPLWGSLLGLILNIKQRVGENRDYRGYFYTIKIFPDYTKHAIKSNLDIARAMKIDTSYSYPIIRADLLVQESVKTRFGLINLERWVGMHLGSQRKQAFKRWDLDKFVEIIQRLSENKYNAILLGGKEEAAEVEEIAIKSKVNPLVAAGKTSLLETMALIKICKLLISNDSGLVHVADALEIPVVAIFGPTDSVRWGPLRQQNRVVKIPLECSPCYQNGKIKCKEIRCIHEISTDLVWGKVADILGI